MNITCTRDTPKVYGNLEYVEIVELFFVKFFVKKYLSRHSGYVMEGSIGD